MPFLAPFLLPTLILSRAIFSIEMSRNGATTPEQFYDWDKDGRWNVGPGELTAAGLRQQYLIGTEMRYNYVTLQSLMTSNLSASQVYVFATDSSRMLMSAEAQALGMYPPGTGYYLTQEQIPLAVPPINITNLAQLQEDLGNAALPEFASVSPIHGETTNSSALLGPFNGGCPKVTSFSNQLMLSSAVAEILAKYPSTMDTLSAVLNLNATEIQANLFYIHSSVESNEFAGFETPLQGVAANVSKMWQEVVTYILYQSDDMNRLAGSPFLQELMWQFYGVMDNVCCYTRKFSLYISSSYTMLMILATLGNYNLTLPPFASVLLFELDETTPFTNPKYSVTVTLNDEPIFIPTCPSTACPFETFMKYVTFRSFPDSAAQCVETDVVQWSSMDNATTGRLSNDQDSTKYSWTLWFAIALVAVVLVSSLVLIWMKFRKADKLLQGRSSSDSVPSDFKLSFR